MLEIPALPEGGAVSDGLKAEHGEDGDRNSTANRWPREETMALLKIRSDMDAAFRDTSPKAPLWDQVSRKLAELGYNRSAKKCKEKFENIYKYHRRTKEGRFGKSNGGKTYRFFEQLEALHGHNPLPSEDATPKSTTAAAASPDVVRDAVPCSVVEHSSSSDSYSSGRKKRKLREFFEGLMKQVIEKQEMLQRKFMEVLDKCERDRIAREDAWKAEELARIKRERELLAQERAIAAAKDEAVLAFLKKFTGVQFTNENFMLEKNTNREANTNSESGNGNGNASVNIGNFIHMSSSRWPKDEVEALIRIRTQIDSQGNHSNNNNKGPLWEEISLEMKNLGYDRSAKRCKEKWENINKYFKRMKEKNKRKPEDSKTCPYYHHLEALYSKKPKKVDESIGSELKPEELLMHIMGSQEGTSQSQQIESSSEDAADRENINQNHGDDENEHQGAYHMVANSPNSSMAILG